MLKPLNSIAGALGLSPAGDGPVAPAPSPGVNAPEGVTAVAAAPAPQPASAPKLAKSDEFTAAETGGWTLRHATGPLTSIASAEATASRFSEVGVVLKPLCRSLSALAKVLAQDKVIRSLEAARYGFGGLASLATGYEQYESSDAKTEVCRQTDAWVSGALDFAFGISMPIVALVDGTLNFALPEMTPGLKEQCGGFISGNLQSAIHGAVAWAESVATGDDRAVREFERKAKKGELGLVFKGGASVCRAVSESFSNGRFSSWARSAQ